MAELAYQQLKKEGEDVARKHASLFSFEFLYIIEEVLLIWPTYAANKSFPYPSVAALRLLPRVAARGSQINKRLHEKICPFLNWRYVI
jgi:hypothetical protein